MIRRMVAAMRFVCKAGGREEDKHEGFPPE
jgi:hypothetical protein